jgi:multiple sugar transport system permease protein
MKKVPMRRRLLSLPGDILILLLVALALLPFLYMVITSLQDTTALTLIFDPSKLDLSNYTRLFTAYGFGQAILTSVIVVVIACVLNLVVCSLAAYAFSKRQFRGSETLFWVFIATMMVPTQVTLIPLYSIIRDLGLVNSYLAIALPLLNAFGVFLIRQFMDGVPDEIIEAARIDGASEITIFARIMLPIIKPVLASLTIFTFIGAWNDFLWPLVSTSTAQMQTVTVAAGKLQGQFATDYGLVMAGATVSFLIPIVMYAVLQRQFVQGVAASGLK